MNNLKLEAPWHTYQKKLNALFGSDPDIIVGDIYEIDDILSDYAIDIKVMNHAKYTALDRVLQKSKMFGNIIVLINLFDMENNNSHAFDIDLFKTIFNGNPIVKDIKDVVDRAGVRHGFVRFQPQVIQFFHDDISDYNGNWSGLAQDIAKEMFDDDTRGVHFCTAALDEPEDSTGAPLGEWP